MKRKTEITFELEETTIVWQEAKILTEFCPQCQVRVKMASPKAIADLSGFTEREIFRLIEAGKIHFTETDRILICLNSISVIKEQ